MSFTALDFILAGLFAIIVIRCTVRGLIEEVMSMAALLLGVAGAFFLYRAGAVFIRNSLDMRFIPEILSFVGIFVLIFILVKVLEYMLRDIIIRISFIWLDRLLGFVFGIVEGFAVISILVFILYVQPVFKAGEILESSFFARHLFPLIGAFREFLIRRAA
ncbi:MAG: CvpA family protein [Spirochaetaceae bacterium]|jgi:membrane protein required for colicin V production|nr:CvpA family protein [Spirochaetaceae bacterium]